ncbi:MAG: hypothetical protein GY730_00500 [bacterium]|nr:hypothetical protein [bacterium]
MRLSRIILVVLVLVVKMLAVSNIYSYSIKTTLENSYAERVQKALNAVYGKEVFFVIVNIDMDSPSYEIKYTQESNPKISKGKSGQKVNLMPGYPVIKNLGPSDLSRLPFDSVTRYKRPVIRRIKVNLYANKAYSKSRARKATKLVNDILSLNTKRDKVIIKFQTFYKKPIPKQTITLQREEHQLLTYQNLFYVLVILLAIIYIYIFYKMQNKKIVTESSGSGAGSLSVNSTVEMPEGAGSGRGGDLTISQAPPIKQYFNFVQHSNINKLIYILKKEKIGVEYIGTMISFLPADLAKQVLCSLDINTQSVIAVGLLQQKMINRPIIEKFEAQLKTWMESLSGGVMVFKDLFNLVSSDNKKQLLALLNKKNSAGYRSFRSNILIFDDLRLLSDDEIKILLSEVNMDKFSIALSSVEEATYQKIDKNLTRSARAMLEQFLELKGSVLTQKEIERAQAGILEVASILEEKKKISLREKIFG